MCKADSLDVFWASATFFPKLPKNVRRIVTVYDLTFRVAPETMGGTHKIAFDLFFRSDVASADSVTTISKGTADRLNKTYGISTDEVVYPAVSPEFRRESTDVVMAALSKYKISTPYLLSVSTWEPRKNLEALVRAYLSLREEDRKDHRLVLIGGSGWKDDRLKQLVGDGAGIVAPGFVPDQDLPALYSGARLFIFPSKYEGFGIPVAEALRCGTQVLASDLPEVREAGGQSPTYIVPTVEGIREGILSALTSAPCSVFSPDISWEESGRRLAQQVMHIADESKTNQ